MSDEHPPQPGAPGRDSAEAAREPADFGPDSADRGPDSADHGPLSAGRGPDPAHRGPDSPDRGPESPDRGPDPAHRRLEPAAPPAAGLGGEAPRPARRQAARPGRPDKPWPVLPGAVLGILGSGQLGRMLALAARRLGYRVAVYSPDPDGPAGPVADRVVVRPYDDLEAVAAFAAAADVVTYEFENVPAETAAAAAARAPVHPAGGVLHTAQDRLREKRFLAEHGLPLAPFEPVGDRAALGVAMSRLGAPAVLKSAGSGYDGKGQQLVQDARPATLDAAFGALGGAPGVLEAYVPFERELSVICARGADGSFAAWPVFQNAHTRHVLDVTLCPAPVLPEVAAEAQGLARRIADALGLVGVLCVELFLLADARRTGGRPVPGPGGAAGPLRPVDPAAGRLLVNELAPRPHNSGHLTLEASTTSQFEQQLRAVCGLPLGDTDTRPAAMANLLGELWADGEPDWPAALARPGIHLHLYGKREPRPGRKMGHLTAVADSAEAAVGQVLAARAALRGPRAPALPG